MSKIPILLGRPFLATERSLIDVEMVKLMLRYNDEWVLFNIFEEMYHVNEQAQYNKIK